MNTPTDADEVNSEREALIEHALNIATKGIQINDGHRYMVPAHDLVEYAETIKALIELLRRTEVPEPSAEYAKVWDAGFFKGWLDRHVARPDADGNFGPTLPLPNPHGNVQHSMACDACGALTFDSARFGAAHGARADGRGCPGAFTTPRKDVEPQGEPSDAQVEAAAIAIHAVAESGASWTDARMTAKKQHRSEARAALRAAQEAR